MKKIWINLTRDWDRYLFWLILLLAVVIRFWDLGKTPISPYVDEVALAYDAYSLAETGADHHGHSWPIVAFESYGDWKPSLYFYLAAGSIRLFGLDAWSVRLPSALAGIMSVIGIYFLVKSFWPEKKSLALWAMLVAATNPWSLHFSHVAFEANVAMSLILWGVICLVKSIKAINNRDKKSSIWLVPSALASGVALLVLSLYTYHAAKIVAPVIGLFLAVVWLKTSFKDNNWRSWWQKFWTSLVIGGLVALFLALPLLKELTSPAIQNRWQETSIFADGSAVLASNNCREVFNFSLASRFFCHRYLFQSEQIVKNYSDNFNLSFLFWGGDYYNNRHSSGFFGLFYPLDLIFLLAGLIALWKKDFLMAKKSSQKTQIEFWPSIFLIFWLLISLVPAALSLPTPPHAIRILAGWPTWIIIIASGISFLVNKWPKYKTKLTVIIIVLIALQFTLYNYHYFNIYRYTSAKNWDSDQKELWETIADLAIKNPNLKNIYVVSKNTPALFYFYYQKISPQLVQSQEKTAEKEESFFLSFNSPQGQNYYFPTSVGKINLEPQSLIAVPREKLSELKERLLGTDFDLLPETAITTSNGGKVWQLVTLVEKGYNSNL